MNYIKLALLLFIATYAITAQAQTALVQIRQPQAPQAAASKDTTKFDTKLPVEITSDSLEVLQHENKAIFKGNVVAVQGEVRLKSDVMIVHYKQKDEKAGANTAKKAPEPPQAAQGEMGAITLIEVQGNVLVATPQESAKGDKGEYDVPTRTLHLFGANVVLTRGKNIMRGTALEYNMETGRSILTNNGTRVRSLFVPNQEQNPAKPDKKPN